MSLRRVLIWVPLCLGLMACIPSGLFDSGEDDDSFSWSDDGSDDEDDCGGSSSFSGAGTACNSSYLFPVCGPDGPNGYPTEYRCDRSSCTWQLSKECIYDGKSPDCVGCTDGTGCSYSTAGECN
jgi:hypothetical protein